MYILLRLRSAALSNTPLCLFVQNTSGHANTSAGTDLFNRHKYTLLLCFNSPCRFLMGQDYMWSEVLELIRCLRCQAGQAELSHESSRPVFDELWLCDWGSTWVTLMFAQSQSSVWKAALTKSMTRTEDWITMSNRGWTALRGTERSTLSGSPWSVLSGTQVLLLIGPDHDV